MNESFILVDRKTLVNCGLVVDDPHEVDQNVRHPDRGDRNWRRIANGACSLVLGERSNQNVGAMADAKDVSIIESWQSEPPCVSVDNSGVRLEICNGRHRMFAIWSIDPELLIPVEVSPALDSISNGHPGHAIAALKVLGQWQLLVENGALRLPECEFNCRFLERLRVTIARGFEVPDILPHFVLLENLSQWRRFATSDHVQKLFVREIREVTLLIFDTSIAVYDDEIVDRVMPLVWQCWGRRDFPARCRLLWREMKLGRERWVISDLEFDLGKFCYRITKTSAADLIRWSLKLKWGVKGLKEFDYRVATAKDEVG